MNINMTIESGDNEKNASTQLILIKIMLISGFTVILVGSFISIPKGLFIMLFGVSLYGAGLFMLKKYSDKPLKLFILSVISELAILTILIYAIHYITGGVGLNPNMSDKQLLLFVSFLLMMYPLLIIPVWLYSRMFESLYIGTGVKEFNTVCKLMIITYLTTPLGIGILFGIASIIYTYIGFLKINKSKIDYKNNYNTNIFDSMFRKLAFISSWYAVIGIVILMFTI